MNDLTKPLLQQAGLLTEAGQVREGLFYDVDVITYDAIPAVRSTYLREYMKAPVLAEVSREAERAGSALTFGTAAHALILEGREPDRRPRCRTTKKDGSTCENHATHLTDENSPLCGVHARSDKSARPLKNPYMTDEQIADLHGMQARLLTSDAWKFCGGWLGSGELHREVTAVAFVCGMLCKARVDQLWTSETGEARITDYKTTTDASEAGALRAARRYRYDVQLAFYRMVLNGVPSTPLVPGRQRYFLAMQEKTDPYLPGVYELTNRAYDEGLRDEIYRALESMQATDPTSGYPAESAPVELDIW